MKNEDNDLTLARKLIAEYFRVTGISATESATSSKMEDMSLSDLVRLLLSELSGVKSELSGVKKTVDYLVEVTAEVAFGMIIKAIEVPLRLKSLVHGGENLGTMIKRVKDNSGKAKIGQSLLERFPECDTETGGLDVENVYETVVLLLNTRNIKTHGYRQARMLSSNAMKQLYKAFVEKNLIDDLVHSDPMRVVTDDEKETVLKLIKRICFSEEVQLIPADPDCSKQDVNDPVPIAEGPILSKKQRRDVKKDVKKAKMQNKP